MPPPIVKWNIQLGSHMTCKLCQGLPLLMRSGNVQEDQLISALTTVSCSQFYRVAGITQVDKVDAFDGAPVFDIEAGNDAFC